MARSGQVQAGCTGLYNCLKIAEINDAGDFFLENLVLALNLTREFEQANSISMRNEGRLLRSSSLASLQPWNQFNYLFVSASPLTVKGVVS